MTEIVRYVTGYDGSKVAFSLRGVGLPLIFLNPYPRSNLEFELRNPKRRHLYDRLAANHTLIRFDYRGMGISTRDVEDISVQAITRDVEAIAQELGLQQPAVLCLGSSVSIGASLAGSELLDVSKFIVWDPLLPKGATYPAVEALRSIMDEHWELFLQARFRIGMSDEEAQEAAEIVRHSASPEFFRRARDVWGAVDLDALMGAVKCPTLILHPRDREASREASAWIATMIPEARLAVVEGNSSEIFNCDVDDVLRTIDSFLGIEPQAVRSPNGVSGAREACPAPVPDLTQREREIVVLLSQGLRSKEIGRQLGLSTHTVERHIANLYRKTGVSGRVSLTIFALKYGIIAEPLELAEP